MTRGDEVQQPGPATDAQGRAVVDPTQNVLDLVRAEARRQDELREAYSKHTRAIVNLNAKHAKDLREAEAKRIDAIRTVDVNAVQAARADAEARATALATQVANQAEAVRTSLAAALEPIQRDIADLRRSQYEGVGGQAKVVETQARAGSIAPWVALAVSGFLSLVAVVVAIVVALL